MKVIRVENFKTGQEYYASVNDDEMRLDPWGIFSDSLQTLTPSHKMSNVRISILKANITSESAAAEVIIQRRLNPNSIKPISTQANISGSTPFGSLSVIAPKIIEDAATPLVENPESVEDTTRNKDFLKNKKGNTNV